MSPWGDPGARNNNIHKKSQTKNLIHKKSHKITKNKSYSQKITNNHKKSHPDLPSPVTITWGPFSDKNFPKIWILSFVGDETVLREVNPMRTGEYVVFVGETFKRRHLHFRNPSGQWWGQFAEMDKFLFLVNFCTVHSIHSVHRSDLA